ncbi:DUF2256 domain-containing protein [Bowmanella denitrificans]|uniref:DUF2256 domain-containing protein n=1 Tax=Bowmanella denitrificans TaxID=366582 RepID=UPI000C99E7ED|nr:DUF2256 domain-containing protein [Bowmanella denitrificans]
MKRNGKTVKKTDLPVKICAQCHRPFRWRKKWHACWEQVQYCSQGCKQRRSGC